MRWCNSSLRLLPRSIIGQLGADLETYLEISHSRVGPSSATACFKCNVCSAQSPVPDVFKGFWCQGSALDICWNLFYILRHPPFPSRKMQNASTHCHSQQPVVHLAFAGSYGRTEAHLQSKALACEPVKALRFKHLADVELQLANGCGPHNAAPLQWHARLPAV